MPHARSYTPRYSRIACSYSSDKGCLVRFDNSVSARILCSALGAIVPGLIRSWDAKFQRDIGSAAENPPSVMLEFPCQEFSAELSFMLLIFIYRRVAWDFVDTRFSA